MAGPPGVAGFLDVAAAASSAGLPRLYVVGSDGEVYATQTSGAPSDGKRGAWAKLAAGVPTKRVAAVGHRDGRQQVFVLSPQGALRSLWQSDAAAAATWSAADAFDGGSLPALVDIDATWTVDGRVQVFAVDANGDMWTRTATGRSPTDGWSAWARWSVPRYAPRASSPPKLDGIVSLAATRWLESGATVLPVVFATDSQGNVYVTSQGSGGWQPWRSFYN
jgi:hypothetical protein